MAAINEAARLNYGEEVKVLPNFYNYLYEQGYKSYFFGYTDSRVKNCSVQFIKEDSESGRYFLSRKEIEKIPKIVKSLDKILKDT